MTDWLNTRLPDGTVARYRRVCESHGTTPSEAVRRLVLGAIGDMPLEDERAPERTAPVLDARPVHSVHVRLTASEVDAIDRRVVPGKGARARWVVQLVRGALTGEPQMTDAELEALRRSTRELAGIGRNVAELTRRLDEAQLGGTPTADMARALTALVEQHTARVERLVLASAERWPLVKGSRR